MLSRALSRTQKPATKSGQNAIKQALVQSLSQSLNHSICPIIRQYTSTAASRKHFNNQPIDSSNATDDQPLSQAANPSVHRSEDTIDTNADSIAELIESINQYSPVESKPSVDRTTFPTHLHGHAIDQSITQFISPTFSDLKLPVNIIQVLEKTNINAPTVIQSAVIPLLMRKPPSVDPETNRPTNPAYSFPDLIVSDQTGEGKTLSYVLPMISQVSPYLQALQSIIVVPTRELAHQIHQTINEVNQKGKKARARNPIRVELAVGDTNPYLISQLTNPSKKANLFHPSDKHPSIPPRDFSDQFDEQLPINQSEVPHIIVGTPKVLHDLLVQKQLIDTRSLKYIVFDEVDALLNKPNSQPYIAPLLQLKSKMPKSFKNMTIEQFNALDQQQQELLKLHPRTQVVLVSATITPPVLSFATVNMDKKTKLITAASLPGECERLGRKLMIGPALSSVAKTSRNADIALTQLPQLPSHLTHHFATVPADTRMRAKADMLQRLCLAIRSSYRHVHPEMARPALRGSKIIRTKNRHLQGGLNAVPPGRWSYIPQTTMVMFTNPHDIFPILPHLTTGDLRVTALSSLSSRTERRDAFSMNPPPDILLCEAALASRGLDFKTVTHIVNWSVPSTALDYVHRAGRVSRKHSVNTSEGAVITMINEGCGDEERVARIVRAGGGRALSQMVVRGDRLYSRYRHTWQPLYGGGVADKEDVEINQAPRDKDEKAPSFVDQLVDPQAVKEAKRGPSSNFRSQNRSIRHPSSRDDRRREQPRSFSRSSDEQPRHNRGQRSSSQVEQQESAPQSSSSFEPVDDPKPVRPFRGTEDVKRQPARFRNYVNDNSDNSNQSNSPKPNRQSDRRGYSRDQE